MADTGRAGTRLTALSSELCAYIGRWPNKSSSVRVVLPSLSSVLKAAGAFAISSESITPS